MKKPNIIALEGSAFAGKTTVLNFLKAHHSQTVFVIPEASECVGGDHHFPPVPFESYEAAKASTHFFLELEKRRCDLAYKISTRTDLIVIMDRSTVLSSVLFYLLLEKQYPNMHEFGESFLEYALNLFDLEIEKGSIFVPSRIAYLHPKNKEVFIKRTGRGTKNNMFAEWSSYRFLHRHYQKIISNYYNKENQNVTISTQNTQESLTKTVDRVLSFSKHITRGEWQIKSIFKNLATKERKKNLSLDAVSESNMFAHSHKISSTLIDTARVLVVPKGVKWANY